ncbi:MAG: RecA/RadA recombinase, partial [Haloquadratum sp. J07HQX50]
MVLGGGFDRGTVTQIYGPPAAGKSNIALSTAVATAINRQRTVYVDTEGVSIDRLDQIASATAT